MKKFLAQELFEEFDWYNFCDSGLSNDSRNREV